MVRDISLQACPYGQLPHPTSPLTWRRCHIVISADSQNITTRRYFASFGLAVIQNSVSSRLTMDDASS
ncbi:hypothetical protein J6590_067531 [Homalodisca vitripennis]|nr:hypothetical protein J6590_067531 [Homalodisca vitripennis]